jgi:FAD binding domain-containing protein
MSTLDVTTTDCSDSELKDMNIASLRAHFADELICPHDPAYDAARRVWNGMIDKRPVLIARCTGVADVRLGIAFARSHDLRVAIRCGGHNAAGHATCDGGMVLDLSPMKGIRVDAVEHRVRAQGGVLWSRRLQPLGSVMHCGTWMRLGSGLMRLRLISISAGSATAGRRWSPMRAAGCTLTTWALTSPNASGQLMG